MRDLKAYAAIITNTLAMRDVLTRYGVTVNRTGYALCPFHSEKTGSLKVYPHSFFCYGCGSGGDAITFVRRLFELSFTDAVQKLNDDFLLGLPIGEIPTIRQKRELKRRRVEITQEVERQRAAEAERFDAYLDLLEAYTTTLDVLKLFAPMPDDDGLNPVFVDALRKRDALEVELLAFRFD